jgi:hypothetical protein
MKFNNKYGLPAPLVTALQDDSYDLKNPPENVISLTTLIAPPKAKILEMRHDEEIEIDVAERLWLVLGTACHTIMEKATGVLHMAEMRWFMDVKTHEVFVTSGRPEQESWYKKDAQYVSGKIDLYSPDEEKLTDYKITSVWSWIMEKAIKPEHDAQLQVNGLAMRILGHSVKVLSVMMMFRDWSRSKNADELPVPFKEVPTVSWTDTEIFDYIQKRIEAHYSARKLKDDEIPECTPQERWARPTVYAMMKPGRKSSVKNFDKNPTPAQMAEFPGCKVEERPGMDVRCMDYCPVGKIACSYYKAVYGIKNVPIEEETY